ncbi:TRAP transporter permease [Ureibacillus massiliensis]|uniref:TRAP transporter permease n=1 Tax=Ureibacillus massiliensis TaxID=292806 RepID=UPI00068C7055|nr:TRAP transporter fused permease subunit [Ureibacillus massiliensis]
MRQFTGRFAIAFSIWAIVAAIFHIYTAYYGAFEPRMQRAIHILFLLPIVFLVFPAKKSKESSKPSILDWILAVAALLPSGYLIFMNEKFATRVELVDQVTTVEMLLGLLVVLLVLEACRRAVSPIFSLIITLFIAYIFVAPYLPGIFNSRAYTFPRVMEIMFLSSDQGVFGFLTGIGSNVIFVFVLFAAVMLRSGVGQFFMDISVALAGKYRGGPAKVAVISSGLYGSISGSSVADVYSTGSFSIPLMKKIGYSPHKAGAIEAVASVGGPLMPPVMGAAAFIMAEMTSTSYTMVIQAALLCAIIYYIGIIATVHFEAVAMNLKAIPNEWNVGWKTVIKKSPYIIPFVVMLVLLLNGISPAKSAVYSLAVMLVLWIIMSRKKFRISELVESFEYAVKSGAIVTAALAGAGMLVAVVNQTGIGLAMGNIIVSFSQGNLWIALFLIMLTVLILGAGIPSTPAYIITATIATGALAHFDIPLLHAHLFVFYFAILADITPPVGVTAFIAANIAEASPMKTALISPRFAFAGFIVPFVFIANPALLMDSQASVADIILSFIVTSIAVIGFSAALAGAVFEKINWIKRLGIIVLSLIIIGGTLYISLIGVLLLATFVGVEYFQYKKRQKEPSEFITEVYEPKKEGEII